MPNTADQPLTIIERLELAATRPAGVRFVGHSTAPAEGDGFVPWAELHDEARAVAAALQARGIIPGDHVAILGPTSRALITIIQGCWLAGAASMVLPLPMRMGSLEAFVESTRGRIRHGDAKLVLIDDQLAAFYDSTPGDPPTEPMAAVMPSPGNPGSGAYVRPPLDRERLVILQYTSGSTSEPKGVMIPDRVLTANLDAIAEAAEMDPAVDVLVSWLPLYHDMGLVGILGTAMTSGCQLVLAAPQDFLARPGNWMQWISDYGGTATAGPNFAWVLATRALGRMKNLDLSSLSVALSGAEPVDPVAVEAFVEAAKPHGFDPGGVFPAFGMAEVGIGGSFPPRGRGMVCDVVDRELLERDRVAKQVADSHPYDEAIAIRRLPLLGKPVPGLEMQVVNPDTYERLPDRHVGELLIRGTSVTPGYYKRDDATAALFHDGWLCTGDLAYMIDGELVLCGRIKDVIIVGGRNVFPEDIERAVGSIEGVRTGNVIAFGVEGYKGKESVVVVAEVRVADSEVRGLETIRHDIHHRALDVCGLPPRDVILVTPGTLPKTSSGKLQRALCREQYLAEQLSLA
jgi:fatty-acyl-CoA synthase